MSYLAAPDRAARLRPRHHSMLNRWFETEGLLEATAELGLGVIGFTALAREGFAFQDLLAS